jgi:mannose-1-phosphate guanylyltransferase
MLIPVVLAGGSGSRLWPSSRANYPKQFLNLDSSESRSLLQGTLQRLKGLEVAAPIVVCNEDHRFLTEEQLRTIGLGDSQILLEPVSRNTAPAIALASLLALERGEPDADPVILVLAADHLIQDTQAFHACTRAALALAEAGKLVTYGVVPTHAETGYGYIEKGAQEGDAFVIKRFVEKPDEATAKAYLESGCFFWNSGMFMFKARRYLEELDEHAPIIAAACRSAMRAAGNDLNFLRVDQRAFEACPSDSVDCAVMEKTQNGLVVPLNAGWSDIGSWSALWEVSLKNAEGNVLLGDAIAHASTATFVHASSRLVAAVGVQDLVIVETKDAVLVAHKDRTQDVKVIVEKLKLAGRSEHHSHREVYRPWGVYDSIDNGERYQVKRITVKPGAKLSVQMHHHRAEHWIVVSGTAQITNGDKTYLLTENQSTYIPIGQVHALENPGKIPLELIEVQSGSYLGEDDIVRFEDHYGRVN